MIVDSVEHDDVPGSTEVELRRLVVRLRKALSGQFTVVPYTAEQFWATTTATTSWIVPLNSSVLSYSRFGQTMTLNFEAVGTTVAGTPTELRITLPAGVRNVSKQSGAFAYADNGTPGTGFLHTSADTNYVSLFKNAVGAAWSASAGATTVFGKAILEVKP